MDKVKAPELDVGDLSAFIEDSFNQLRADTEVYNQIKALNVTNKVVRDHIATFLEFQEDIHYCAACPGLAHCQKDHPHFQLHLSYDGKFLERSYAPCPVILRKWELDAQYPIADIPDRWRENAFATIDATQERAVLIQAADQVIQGASKRWLYVTGNPRMGKSYLAAAIAGELVNIKKGPVAFLNVPVRFKELNDLAFSDKEGFRKVLDLYLTVPVLVLDDFGNEYKNDYVRDTILYPILSERSKNGRLTLFTSDFTFEEIAKMYGGTSAGQIRANQLKKLLIAMCQEPIELKGVSLY